MGCVISEQHCVDSERDIATYEQLSRDFRATFEQLLNNFDSERTLSETIIWFLWYYICAGSIGFGEEDGILHTRDSSYSLPFG